MKSPFMIYINLESILVPENNEMHSPDDSCTNKYQSRVGCSFGYKLAYIDDQFSKPFSHI